MPPIRHRAPRPAPAPAPAPAPRRPPRAASTRPEEVADDARPARPDLRDQGLITPEEYEAKKAELLGRI